MEDTNELLKLFAIKIAPEYPDIANVSPREQLSAIYDTHLGDMLALEDYKNLLVILCERLHYNNTDLKPLWEQAMEKTNKEKGYPR